MHEVNFLAEAQNNLEVLFSDLKEKQRSNQKFVSNIRQTSKKQPKVREGENKLKDAYGAKSPRGLEAHELSLSCRGPKGLGLNSSTGAHEATSTGSKA